MRIGLKTWLPAVAVFGLAAFASDEAAAQCGPAACPPPPPPCCAPPPPPPPPPTPCCAPPPAPPNYGGHANINVNVNVNANASARASAGARGGSTIIVGGGGGAYFNVDQPYPTTITNLNVGGSMLQTIRVPYEERRRVEKRVAIQAVCIDARNVPHPAAQVRPDRDVWGDYDGELYRCLSGTWLQASIADYHGEVSFDGGETLQCRRGDALWHGRGGRLECRPQKPERDCNERSLLRRYGAGIKILTLVREEVYTAYREEVVEGWGQVVSGAAITLDGGVGGRVF